MDWLMEASVGAVFGGSLDGRTRGVLYGGTLIE